MTATRDRRPERSAGRARSRRIAALPELGAAAGLLVVALLTLALASGQLPFLSNGRDDQLDGPIKTPTPSDVIVVDPRTKVPGTITYVKAGNIWTQSGERAYQLTTGGRDAMPSWSPDGAWIYFIRLTPRFGRILVGGVQRQYDLDVPSVMRVRSDGDGVPETLLSGTFERGSTIWSFFIRQPVVSPDDSRLALVSDGPDPTKSDVVLQYVDLATRSLATAAAPQNKPFGHQDPAWSPDGGSLLYVRNGRDGSRGAPTLMRLDLATGKSSAMAGPGYVSPAWSPDGRFVAVTSTDGFGTDVVMLEARTGIELLRLTSDGRSFSPEWSPAGDAIAYLHIDGGVVDLVLVTVIGSGPTWTLGETLPLTAAAGLDPASRPDWHIPAELLPAPTPSPTPSPAASPSPSAVP